MKAEGSREDAQGVGITLGDVQPDKTALAAQQLGNFVGLVGLESLGETQ